MNNDTIEMNVEEVKETPEKVYTFRKLQSTDMFLMFKILNKIGVKGIMETFNADTLKNAIKVFKAESKDEANEAESKDETAQTRLGIAIMLQIADIVLTNIPKCENEVYEMLSNTSNLSVEQVKTLDLITFTEMVVDFVKKEEFKGFIKVVLRLFKQEN